MMVGSFMLVLYSLIILFIGVWIKLMNMVFFFQWELIELNSMVYEYVIYLDWLMMLFISVVLFISSMVVIYSIEYIGLKMKFFYLKMLFVISMVLMILSPNMISLLVGWDGLGLISYLLVIYYNNESSYSAGMITYLFNRVGDVGLLLLISMSYLIESFNLFLYSFYMNLMMILIFMSSFTKSAQIPFSVWLPKAMAAPTPISSLVHSSTLVTAGVYLLIRYSELISSEYMIYFLMISLLTMFMSSLAAMFEFDMKKIVALSTLSQIGLMMVILIFGNVEMSFFHLLVHAIFKSMLFMCVGVIIHMSMNNQDLRLAVSLKYFPELMIMLIGSLMTLMGFPFLSSFYSKDLILEFIQMSKINYFVFFLMILSFMLTISYSLRLMKYLIFGRSIGVLNIYDSMNLMISSMYMLFIFSIVMGIILMNLFFIGKLVVLSFSDKMLILLIWLGGFIMFKLVELIDLEYFRSMIYMNYMYYFYYKFIDDNSLVTDKYLFNYFLINYLNVIMNVYSKVSLMNVMVFFVVFIEVLVYIY